MVTQKSLTKPRVPDYSSVEQIPDPPRRYEMNEYPHIEAFTSRSAYGSTTKREW